MNITPELRDSIVAYQNGDANAFTPLYENSKNYVFNCIYKVMNNDPNAYDVSCELQNETYMEISQSIYQLQNVDAFLSWAGTIATRKCLDYIRKNGNAEISFDDDSNFVEYADSDEIIPENVMQNQEKQQMVKNIIDKELSQMQRLCIIAYYYNGIQQTEIATTYNIPVNTVRTNLSRAKKKIKDAVVDIETHENIKLYSLAPLMGIILASEMQAMSTSSAVASSAAAGTAAAVAADQAGVVGIAKGMGDMGMAGAAGTMNGVNAVGAAGTMNGVNAVGAAGTMNGVNAVGTAGTMNGMNAVGAAGTMNGMNAVGAAGMNVAGATGAAGGMGSAGATAAGVAAKVGLSLGAKIAIGILTTAALVGGGFGIAHVVGSSDKKKDTTTTEIVQEYTETENTLPEGVTVEDVPGGDITTEAPEPTEIDLPIASPNEGPSVGVIGWKNVPNDPKSIKSAYQSVVINMKTFMSEYPEYDKEYTQYDYMYYDYDMDGIEEVVFYNRFPDGDESLVDVWFLMYDEASQSIRVRGVSTNENEESEFYAAYSDGSMVRYSWRTSPMESYVYKVVVPEDKEDLIFVLEVAYDEILVDYENYGMRALPLYLYTGDDYCDIGPFIQ